MELKLQLSQISDSEKFFSTVSTFSGKLPAVVDAEAEDAAEALPDSPEGRSATGAS